MKLTKKTLGRAAAAFLATAMLASFTAIPAFAAGVTSGSEEKPVTSVTITKKVETDGKTYAPNTSFTFNVEEGPGKTFNDGHDNVTAEAGVEGGLTAGTNGAAFAPVTENDGTYVAPAAEYTATDTLTVNGSVFEKPGVYHYTVTENDTSYEGITKDSSVYDVYLYVYNNADYTGYYVGHVVAVKNGDTAAKSDLEFTNDYGKTYDTTHDVKVTKIVAGNQGDRVNDEFNFTVKVEGNPGEAYKVVVDYDSTTTNQNKDQEFAITSDEEKTVTIKHNGTIQIFGLSETDTYTIAETTGADEAGYAVSDDKGTLTDGIVSGTVTHDGEAYTVTNTKAGNVPTGIVMNVAPYVLLVVVAAAGCLVFLRKRNNED